MQALGMLRVGRCEHLRRLTLFNAFAQQAGGAKGQLGFDAGAGFIRAGCFRERFAQAARCVHAQRLA
jgi:hypothetical protein